MQHNYFFGIPSKTSCQSELRVTKENGCSKHSEKIDKSCSDLDSNFTSISQLFKTQNIQMNSLEAHTDKFQQGCNKAMTRKEVLTNSIENHSDGLFLATMVVDRKSEFRSSLQDNLSRFTPLRLFNKKGKPLTDRTGRSLANIFGEPLVLFDDSGRLVSDIKGNQIFNCFGESAIHSNTDLRTFPIEEPGIPVMDFHKKHILFLFDSKGHPMTDTIGRPLLKASGKRMFGIDPRDTINASDYKDNQLKSMYGKSPLENVVRRIQIFNADLIPLTDENGNPLYEGQIICNKDGMPICDDIGRPLYFNYGARIFTPQKNGVATQCFKSSGYLSEEVPLQSELNSQQNSLENHSAPEVNVVNQVDLKTNKSYNDEKLFLEKINVDANTTENLEHSDMKRSISITNVSCGSDYKTMKRHDENELKEGLDSNIVHENENKDDTPTSNTDNFKTSANPQHLESGLTYNNADLNEAIIILDGTKKLEKKPSPSTKVCLRSSNRKISESNKRDFTKSLFTSSVIECLRNSLNLPTLLKTTDQAPLHNTYGKPTRDLYGNPLYDKYGIPLTGAHGIKINEKARHALRVKLKNTSINAVPQNEASGFITGANDNSGEPYYDKYGRPLYDLFGRLMYDVYGRPLTDAFGRPLVDAIGQPLMDSKGNVLTAAPSTYSTVTLTDIFGRPLHDKNGRSLFDTYGRPRFDIYTNAIYDSCGRPAKDGNDAVLFDFLNKPIQRYPENPLYKNARALLPRYIDKILEVPSMYRVFKFSKITLKDLFGGPLFDDFGRPLYNKKGKPLFDKYGRPLYDKDGKPLCDCYGRPLSEEIRESPNDQTLSVVDSLKLLRLTNESSQWMEMKRSEMQGLKSSNHKINDDAVEMNVLKPSKDKSSQYVYALTRVTTFSSGRQVRIIQALKYFLTLKLKRSSDHNVVIPNCHLSKISHLTVSGSKNLGITGLF